MGGPSTRYIAEFVGTFLLVLAVGCNVLTGSSTWAATSIACTLMVSIYALGGVSGAHFNPAVTAACFFAGKVPAAEHMEKCIYIACQLAGGITAGAVYRVIAGDSFNLSPGREIEWWQAAMAEVIYTFMLCFVVLNVATSKAHAGKDQFYGLAIGFVIVAGGYAGGPLSGGAFNPAVAFGIDVVSVYKGFGWCLAYTLFEIVGAALAAGFYHLVRPDDYVDTVPQGRDKYDYGIEAKLMSEFLGTYMLVVTVGLNVLAGSPAGAFSIAAALMCMIFSLGTVSGAHFNPAVTCAVVVGGRPGAPKVDEAGAYVLAQLCGGLGAALTYSLAYKGKTFELQPGADYSMMQALAGEFFFTFLLAFVVLSVATVAKPLSQYFGLAIGACVIAGGCAIGAVSGGSLNPAVSFGLTLTGMQPWSLYQLNVGICYMVVELVAGCAAAGAFHLTHPEEYVSSK